LVLAKSFIPRSNVKLGRTGQNSIVTDFLCFLLMALLRSCRYPIHNFNVILISAIISAIILIVYYVAINVYSMAPHLTTSLIAFSYSTMRTATRTPIVLGYRLMPRFPSSLECQDVSYQCFHLSPGIANLSRKCSAATPTQAEGENNHRTLNLKAMCGRQRSIRKVSISASDLNAFAPLWSIPNQP
jgi:hypothetical protein